jgi:glycosyl transferase, family 25
LKSFVINLNRRPDRLTEITATLDRLKVPFERISAVDARAVDTTELVTWREAHIYNDFKRPVTGQIGVYYSHRLAWQKMLDLNIDQALIFEDDVVPLNFDPKILNIKLKDYGLDQLRLEELKGDVQNVFPTQGGKIAILDRVAEFVPTYGAAAYIITKQGAQKYLSAGKFWFNIDHFDMWENVVGAKTAILRPNMFIQSGSESDIVIAIPNSVHSTKMVPNRLIQPRIKFSEFIGIKTLTLATFVLSWKYKIALKKRLVNRIIKRFA